jgi:hypothetical protein
MPACKKNDDISLSRAGGTTQIHLKRRIQMARCAPKQENGTLRRSFIGGSDARVIMGGDEPALQRLWREKRGEAEPEDHSGNLVMQLGLATEALNRQWFERTTGQVIKDAQSWVRHPVIRWMAATLDGIVEGDGAVFEAKFMLPWSFSEEAAAEKHMAQLQHNMWVTNATAAVLSIITGGGNWRCVESGEPPRLFGIDPPRPQIEAVRIVDMSSSNSWAEFAGMFPRGKHTWTMRNQKLSSKA